ncbi:hypothetical protein SEPCBS57363_000436 [Sporothrix epigloea]|uniref:Sterol regulatory element-binding protein cleavage-activating protein n=1 Tax=Sporothrix epigloea TaxID=1892477 RepID=A0ABP0D4M8_9PEZI
MLWYLLYPIRRTTSAPILKPDHPIRRILSRYGVYVARNVATTLLISIAVATALIYPIPFLYTSDFASGASGLPNHVWTNAQPIKGAAAMTAPDVFMRSIWVHGSYMRALERDVLLGALELQNDMLGPTMNFNPRSPSNHVPLNNSTKDLTESERNAFHVINGLTNQSWFFHSPLLYWSGDGEMIQQDSDIIATVNEHKNQHTSVNITLRHSVVFSGKRFEDRALVAADALVITLIHLRDSPVGRQWERKETELRTDREKRWDKWDVYPKGAHNLSSQLYEFQFLPISIQDWIMLALAYSATIVYLIQNLSKLPAIKSRPGLIVTVIAQIFVSIMSSFTVCAILKIDLSRIPRAAYPIVIVSMSLENMLRLIRGVIATNLEESTSNRIGAAFGKTTHIASASVLEHLLLLWGISKLVTPSLSDFCAFLAIAIVFDFFYLSTFFLSVLSVEVRRSELSEFLEKSSAKWRRQQSSSQSSLYALPNSSQHGGVPRKSWIAAVLKGRIDVSTRIAGTVIMLGFVIIAQWHFFENESISRTFSRLFTSNMESDNNLTSWGGASAQLQELHQARSPTSWLRLQDHETAQEVINVVKPTAHSYIARVYEPLVLVLKGSDRMPSVAERPFLPAVYDFIRHQSKPFLVTIFVLTAAMRIFINYLLWDEMSEHDSGFDTPNEPLLSVKSMDQGHALDIALLAASSDGLVVSVGLDRWIRVWNVPFGGMNYLVTNHDAPSDVPFPVLALAIDDDSTWLAILSSSKVMLWNLESRCWGPSIAVELCGQKPEAFFFTCSQRTALGHSLVAVRRNGTLVELWPDTGESQDSLICKSPLICAVSMHQLFATTLPGPGGLTIMAISRNGSIYRVIQGDEGWKSEEVKGQADHEEHAHYIVALPLFSAYLVARPHSVELVDLSTCETLHTFKVHSTTKPRSLRHLCARRQTQRGSLALSYFSLIYTSAETGNCVMQTYLPKHDDGSILFSPDDRSAAGTAGNGSRSSCMWHEARQVVKEVPNPGLWEALPNGSIIGVRQTAVSLEANGGTAGLEAAVQGSGTNSLRRRGLNVLANMAQSHNAGGNAPTGSPSKRSPSRKPVFSNGRGIWEAWSMSSVIDSASGNTEEDGTSSQCTSNSNTSLTDKDKNYVTRALIVDESELLTTEPGPIICLGAGTIALGLGAAVKIITMGHERFGSPAEMLEAAAGHMLGTNSVANRRRKNRSLQKGAVA